MEKHYEPKENLVKLKREIDEAIIDDEVYQLRKQVENICYKNGK